jgi:hypothetical protein
MSVRDVRLSEIRQIVAHAVGLTPADMSDDVNLLTTFAADWRAIEAAMAQIENKYGVNISMDEIGDVPTILSIYRATAPHANWGE